MSETILDRDDSLVDLDREALTMAVAELLETHGWETEFSLDPGSGDADRIATRDGERYLLRTVPADSGPITTSTVTAATNAREQTGTTGLVLVSVAEVTEDAHEYASTSDSIDLFDVDSAEALDERLGSTTIGQPADAALWGPADPADHENGATAADVEAAVPDVDTVTDDEDPTPQRLDPETDPETDPEATDESATLDVEVATTDSESTDDEISASVRDTERRMIVGELLLQIVLALGLLACASFVLFRLAQVLL